MESDDLFGEMSDDDSDDLTIVMGSDDLLDETEQEEPELSLDADLTSEPSLEDVELSEDADLNLEESDLESLADMDGDDASILKLEDLVEPEDIEGAELEQDDDLMEEEGLSLASDADIDIPREALEPSEQTDQELDIQEADGESAQDDEPSLGLEGPAEFDTSKEIVTLEQEKEPAEDLTAETDTDAETADTAPIQEQFGITEEKIESIIREAVEDVVEKVARETIANVAEKVFTEATENLKGVVEKVARETTAGVAEKVITEAIDALKNSLESPSE
jgi:hypothetical protein